MTNTAGAQQMPHDENLKFWHQSLRAAALAEDFKLAGGDSEYGQTVMTSYEGCPPQMATQVCFSERAQRVHVGIWYILRAQRVPMYLL